MTHYRQHGSSVNNSVPESFSLSHLMWYFFSEVQQILFVAYVLHAPMVAHSALTISQTDLQCDGFWVPTGKGKNRNRKHERLLYLRQSLSLCSASGWLQCSVIPDTTHTPKCSIYSGRIPAAWSGKGIISQRYSGWWICRCCLCIPMATSPLSEELWCIRKKNTASQAMMRQDVGGRNGGVWKTPVEKYIHITPINTTGASVTTLAAVTPTTCLCALTLCWIQSSSHVKQPHLCSAYAYRHLQTHGSFRGLRLSRYTTTWWNFIWQVEHFWKLRG